MKFIFYIKSLILLLLLSESLLADEEEIHISIQQVRPGNQMQRLLLKAFEAYNSNIQAKNDKLSRSHYWELESKVEDKVRESYCFVRREYRLSPVDGRSIYLVSIQPLDYSGDRTFKDTTAFLRFNNVVELASDSRMFFHFEETDQMLKDYADYKYPVFDVNAFGSFKEVVGLITEKEKESFPAPLLQKKLSQNEYISKVRAEFSVTSIEPEKVDIKCSDCKGIGKVRRKINARDAFFECKNCDGEKKVKGFLKYIVRP